jgi:hypothetical protein
MSRNKEVNKNYSILGVSDGENIYMSLPTGKVRLIADVSSRGQRGSYKRSRTVHLTILQGGLSGVTAPYFIITWCIIVILQDGLYILPAVTPQLLDLNRRMLPWMGRQWTMTIRVHTRRISPLSFMNMPAQAWNTSRQNTLIWKVRSVFISRGVSERCKVFTNIRNTAFEGAWLEVLEVFQITRRPRIDFAIVLV